MEERDNSRFPDQSEQMAIIQPVNVRSLSMVVLATVAAVYFIDWAQPVLLPLVVAVLISYALDPLVAGLQRLGLPRALSATLVLISVITTIAAAGYPLQREAMEMLDKVPVVMRQFQHQEQSEPKEESAMEKAQIAAKEIEAAAERRSGNGNRDTPGVQPVRIVEKPFDLQKYLMEGASSGLVLITQCFSVLVLVFFVLSVGSLYKRKGVRIAGPSFGRMRRTARMLNEFHHQVRRFLFVMLLGALFVGVLTWLAFLLLGVEQSVFWGVIAGVASAIPYLGPFLVMIGTGAAGFIQFGSIDMALLIAGVTLVITSIQGYLLTPMLTSRVSSLNEVVIFIGLLFWGWLWGPVGLIIATPLLMIIKTLCDHVTNLRPLGELLGK